MRERAFEVFPAGGGPGVRLRSGVEASPWRRRRRQIFPVAPIRPGCRGDEAASSVCIRLRPEGLCAARISWHRLCLTAGVIDPVFQSTNYILARQLLDATALRHEAIATNVANAETPGFRRLDVSADFAQHLRSQVAAGQLSRQVGAATPHLVEDTTARSMRPDGNTVEIERELLAMNRNSVEYAFLTEVVSSNLKQLRMAISGRVV